MFSVCADGSVVWYFWCPGCRGELRFLYCELGWRCMEVCVMGICGESRDVYVVFGIECRG